ncbi:hypothetical protein DTO164E3_4518 [Paecilomyces variotii]|nr:hypothetical protein DTO164E3_4518 [Paecilomyces variotii]KAJ9203351.1 hypothetical protein DTO032I3_3218 [Paecilomyces variotii]KAJ9242802.1 hypothetical protein DTO169E5_2973 [Paecilomyces variotii]KAJ9266356.1 hypothetical protein DTO212C5_6443 [Paecilomyces variotii]KAJ9278913.1 hypothetical protein DTO021D3_4229 [Paecilomyces variotii]
MLLGLISPDFVRYISGKPDVLVLLEKKLLTPGQAHLQQNPSLKPSTSPFLSHRHTLRKVTSCTLHRLIYLQDQAALRSI